MPESRAHYHFYGAKAALATIHDERGCATPRNTFIELRAVINSQVWCDGENEVYFRTLKSMCSRHEVGDKNLLNGVDSESFNGK